MSNNPSKHSTDVRKSTTAAAQHCKGQEGIKTYAVASSNLKMWLLSNNTNHADFY